MMVESKPTVLFVDDDAFVIAAMRRMLRPLRDEFDLHFMEDPREALQQLQSESCDVLISDLQMPYVNGSELLKLAQMLHPGAVRYALSGQADPQRSEPISLVAHGYLPKPCEPETLHDLLTQIRDSRKNLPGAELRNMVTRLTGLPLTSASLAELEEFRANPHNSANITHLADTDPGLASNILRLSCFAGNGRELQRPSELILHLRPDSLVQLLAMGRYDLNNEQQRQLEEARSYLDQRARSSAIVHDSVDQDESVHGWLLALQESRIPVLRVALAHHAQNDDERNAALAASDDDMRCADFYLRTIWRITSRAAVPSAC
jgi:CheY-like chemotaxis protein